MPRYNHCQFIGHLAADAETKALDGGDSLVKFRIRVSGYKRDSETLWISCAWFGERAAKVQQYIRKGQPIMVIGELQVPRTYQSQGETRVALEVRVQDVVLLGSRDDAPAARAAAPARKPARDEDPFGEDAPF